MAAPTDEVDVFRIPVDWYQRFDHRTDEEVLRKLGFVQVPGGGWACDDRTARVVVNTALAYSFGWRHDGSEGTESSDG